MKSFVLVALLGATTGIQVTKFDTCGNQIGGSCHVPQWPGEILPGSAPIMPKSSKPVDEGYNPTLNAVFDNRFNVQLNSELEASARSNARAQITSQIRASLEDNDGPIANDYLMLQMQNMEICETVECAREQAAQMQAQLDAGVAEADAKREAQQKAFEQQDSNDPASQLQGLMNAQQSLKRLTSGFSAKPNVDKVTTMAQKLGIPMTPELMQLGNNEAISNALVEIAVGMGKTEEEIGAALGAE